MRLSTKLTIAMSLVAAILHFSVRNVSADQLGFAVDNTGSLFSVDLTTATATPIGFTGQFLQGLAFSPAGSLFGTDFLGNLYSVSKTTGAATFIGSTSRRFPLCRRTRLGWTASANSMSWRRCDPSATRRL